MHSQTMSTLATGESDGNVRGWAIVAGITMVVLGTAAILYDVTATLASVFLFGWLLLLAGAIQTVQAFQVRTWSGFFLYLVDGIIRATVGTLPVAYPGSGALTLTLMLGFYFIVGGLFKIIVSMILQFPSWGWSAASGLVSVALGAMLAMQMAGVWRVVHRLRRRPRPDLVWLGAADVRHRGQEHVANLTRGD